MKLLIVSHTPHYRKDALYAGWGATVREIDQLSTLFEEVFHLAPLHVDSCPNSAISYSSPSVRLLLVPSAGGERLIDKLSVIFVTPIYIFSFLRVLGKVDVVHIRCPANISLILIILLIFMRHPRKRWIKYAGNWRPEGKDALSYRFQRWWLTKNFARAHVTVNGKWHDSPSHIHAFLNPCLTQEELLEGNTLASKKQLTFPLHFLFVGRVEESKGVAIALNIISKLISHHIDARFDIVGDGAERSQFENLAAELGIQESVIFHGWKTRSEINKFYHAAHFMLFPSTSSEGWPKVLSEAMAYGVVPLASSVSSIPQYLQQFQTGHTFPAYDIQAFVESVLSYRENPQQWLKESANSVHAAQLFSYDAYLESVRALLQLP